MSDDKPKSEVEHRLANAFRELDGPLCELRCQARCATYLMDDIIGTNPTTEGIYRIPENQREMLLFSVYQLQRMIIDLEKDWSSAFEQAWAGVSVNG